MSGDEPPKNDKLRLVADNDSVRIAEHQKQVAADDARDQAATSLATLVANLLRVLAGGGHSYAVPSDLLKTCERLRDAYNEGYRGQMPGLEDLSLYHLFDEGEERDRPRTEEEWRRWAADNPRRDYDEERRLLLHALRRHVLREIASTITGSDLQIRREAREIDDVLRQLEEVRDRYLNGSKRPPSPYRQSIAEHEIAKLRGDKVERRYTAKQEFTKVGDQQRNLSSQQEIVEREINELQAQKCDQMIARLQAHQWAALRAVDSGAKAAHSMQSMLSPLMFLLA